MIDEGNESWRLMVVAGEASGDTLAAKLVHALRAQAPHAQFDFFGATSGKMRAAGVEEVVCADHLAITGLLEAGRALPVFWRAFQTLKQAALKRRPDAVILVDWPDFNLRLARSLHRRGLKVIYYVSPQLWAWRAKRIKLIQRDVDMLLAILPFEPDWYKRRGVHHVEFVGHPLVGMTQAQTSLEEFRARHGLSPAPPIIALLPGSRRKELLRNLPLMLEAAKLVLRIRPATQFVLALAPDRSRQEAAPFIAALAPSVDAARVHKSLRIVENETYDALAAADAAAVASGTATLEAALIGTPLVVVYKESALNWHTLGRLINTEHFGLVNLVAGERIATELMQHDFTAARLASELLALLDPLRNQTARAQLRTATARLGAGGASERTADAVLHALRTWKTEADTL
ncbi:MAG: lipid-A-disaccharide synthase [Pyrinomonadaceae bacterium]